MQLINLEECLLMLHSTLPHLLLFHPYLVPHRLHLPHCYDKNSLLEFLSKQSFKGLLTSFSENSD